MITLDQILLLESRVRKAVERIETLTRENDSLREKLSANERRIGELEVLISTFKEDQGKIEQGILNALEQLDQLEDEIDRKDEDPAARAAADTVAQPDAAEQAPASGSASDSSVAEPPATDATDADGGPEPVRDGVLRETELDIF